ncbi:MAG: hypothetical protein Q8O83_03205 [bacterium]|nr:hypothetical protein [bacterium]
MTERFNFWGEIKKALKFLGVALLISFSISIILWIILPYTPTPWQEWIENTGFFLGTYATKMKFYCVLGLIMIFIFNMAVRTLLIFYKAFFGTKDRGAIFLLARTIMIIIGIIATYYVMNANFIQSTIDWCVSLITH